MMHKTTLILFLSILFLHSNQIVGQEFITTWKVLANDTITIPTAPGSSYNYNIDWGDLYMDSTVMGDISHTYDDEGVYTVKISGTFPRIYFNDSGDKDKIISIDKWGNIEWESMTAAFHGCYKLQLLAEDLPDFSNVTSLNSMFRQCTQFTGNSDMNNWDTSTITDMTRMFNGAANFNQYIGDWNTSMVASMASMFNNASIFNQDISYKSGIDAWNTSKVTIMGAMFFQASNFNKDIGNWNTSMVTNMGSMFRSAENFNVDISYKPTIDAWNTGKVTNMNAMFLAAFNFNQDIGNWNTSNVTNMKQMFWAASSFDQDIGNWSIDSLDNIYSMLNGAISFDQDLSNWDFSSITSMADFLTFSGLGVLNYDRLLQSWVDQDLSNKDLGAADGVQYCNVTAHDKLISELGWTITDDVIGSPASSNWTHLNANWYDNETHWSDMAFPTLCTDVLIPDTKNINIQVGQKAMAATLEVELGAVLDIPLGAELIVDPQ